jgi:hypothetical protein
MSRACFSQPLPPLPDTSRLLDAAGVRWYLANHHVYLHMTDAQLGEHLGLSAGFVGMVRSGTRRPSKAFLDAIGWESVTLYRMKKTLRPRPAAELSPPGDK